MDFTAFLEKVNDVIWGVPLIALILSGGVLFPEKGEYVAVVGKSGCGKSTLMRILLGFEEPEQGAVYYDSMDLGSLDKRALRRNIGTVLQDGRLFSGDIYSNIIISAPWMSMDDAWDAAEKVGMAEDIRRMPMGMHTLITEGSGGISGGQKQRILIAHRLSTIRQCDRIIVLDGGVIAVDGTYEELLAQGGLFAELVEKQMLDREL